MHGILPWISLRFRQVSIAKLNHLRDQGIFGEQINHERSKSELTLLRTDYSHRMFSDKFWWNSRTELNDPTTRVRLNASICQFFSLRCKPAGTFTTSRFADGESRNLFGKVDRPYFYSHCHQTILSLYFFRISFFDYRTISAITTPRHIDLSCKESARSATVRRGVRSTRNCVTIFLIFDRLQNHQSQFLTDLHPRSIWIPLRHLNVSTRESSLITHHRRVKSASNRRHVKEKQIHYWGPWVTNG